MAKRPPRVLLVESSLFNLYATEDLMLDNGLQVEAVSTFQDCLIKATVQHFDIVVLSYNLEDAPGAKALKLFREKRFHWPLIITVNSPTSDMVQHCMAYKVMDVMIKPIRPRLFVSRILRLWETI